MKSDQFDKCLGIELKLLSETTFSRRSCVLTKKGNALNISSTSEASGTLTQILADVPRGYPVALCLSGKGVLHKVVNSIEERSGAATFTAAFPAINPDDFYYQVYRDEEKSLVSIIRKNVVDGLLKLLSQAGIQLFSVSLGPAVTSHIWAQMNIYGGNIHFDGHLFELSTAKALINYKYSQDIKSEFGLKIAEQNLNEEFIVAYAIAFQLILYNRLNQIDANVKAVKDSLNDYLENKKIQLQGLVALIIIFVALLGSFLVFFHYNTENAFLETTMGKISSEADQTQILNRRIKENSDMIEEYLGWNGGYNYGFLVDEIGASLTRRVVLDAISINETTSTATQKKESKIRILGTSDDLNAVNNWVFILKDKPWVKKVSLDKYQKEPDSDRYSFSLDLTY